MGGPGFLNCPKYVFLSLKTDFFGKISKKILNDPGGGRVTSKEKVPKNNNFFSDPFPKLKEGISVKNNLRKKQQ